MSPSAAPGPAVTAAGAAEATTYARSKTRVARVPEVRLVLRRRHGRAELLPVLNSKMPRPVQQHRNGASKTVLSTTSLKEATTYGQGAYQQRREPHRPDVLDVGQEGQGPPGPCEGREEEVTAPTVETPTVNVTAIERDIAALLTAHGLGHHDTIQVAVAEIVQAGQVAGVSITGMAYTPPPGVPTQRPDRDLLGEIAEDLEVAAS